MFDDFLADDSTDTIQFACGHEAARPDLPYENSVSWMAENGQCADCWKRGQRDTIAEHAAEFDLPALRGSEKQIAWAVSIRYEMLSDLQRHAGLADDLRRNAMVKRLDKTYDAIVWVATAGLWIENRLDSPEQFAATLKAMLAPRRKARR